MENEHQPKPEGHGESHGEWKKRILLEEVNKRAKDGLPVDEILPLFLEAMNRHETEIGGDPEKISGALDKDDVSSTLLELEKEGKIRMEGGKVYQVEE